LNRNEPNAGELKPKTANPIGRKNAQKASGAPIKDSHAPIGATQGTEFACDFSWLFVAQNLRFAGAREGTRTPNPFGNGF
jgi:hypothetical protein